MLADDSTARERYQVGWAVRVDPGDDAGLCAEAAAWLVASGALMPGEPVFDDETTPTESEVADSCVQAIESFEGAGSDAFATWPNTSRRGLPVRSLPGCSRPMATRAARSWPPWRPVQE